VFNHPTNSRANRFNGKLPPAPSDSLVPHKDFIDNVWLHGERDWRLNRFRAANPIGRGPSWRKGSKFDCGDKWRRPLDRNDRARVMFCAETFERRTKQKHKRDGLLGISALIVLRCLLMHFQDSRTGRLDPGYDDIQRITGFCRQTIRNALRNLEVAGILEVMRRVVRARVRVWVEEAKKFFVFDRVVQTTNAYMVNYPLPDRQEYGDLGAPLLRPEKYRLPESRLSTESTKVFISKSSPPLNPDLQNALDALGRRIGTVS
jgi:hypothetical protein